MTRRQLFKNFGLGLAGLLALPLLGKPDKASEPVLPMTDEQVALLNRFVAVPSSSGEFATTQEMRYASWHGSADGYRAYLCDLRAQQLQLMRDGALMNKYPPVIS